jgi:hypothetical protein
VKHKIFLVHGMGVYDGNTWADEVKAVLVEAYGHYPRLAANAFDDQFEIVMVHYDPIFQEIVTRWQNDAKAIAPLASQVGASEVASMVGWLQTAGKTNGNFIWSHAADVLLYRLSALVRERVKAAVAKQIVDGVQAQYDDAGTSRWSVIAHSLGTSVAHDALDMLATGDVPGAAVNAFDPKHEQAVLVAMVANVSRVLETIPDAYRSSVQPGKGGQAGRCCRGFLNVRHFLDPFTIPRMFHPQDWPDADTAARKLYRYVEVQHVHQVNVHDICHYLRNPAAHIPLFRMLTSDASISAKQEADAIAHFPQFGTLSSDAGGRIKGDLETVTPSVGADWPALRKIWDEFHTVLQFGGHS